MKSSPFFLLIICLFFSSVSFAQSVSGSWYGVGVVKREGEHNSYLSELILKQNGKTVTGEFNYFFRDAEIKTKISGTYNAKSRTLLLKAIPVINYQAKNVNGADCPMQGLFTLKVSRVETSLSGQFTPTYNYRLTCPVIAAKFVKSTPQNRVAEPPLVEENEEPQAPTPPPPPPVVKKQEDPNEKVIKALSQRSFDAPEVIEVDTDSLKVTLYDLGEVDNDTISLFYNRQPVAVRQMLSDKPLTFTLPLDTTVNEISMFAENLGRFPPNTALAIIYAGEKRYEFSLTSTFIKNAAIRFKRKPKTTDPKNIN